MEYRNARRVAPPPFMTPDWILPLRMGRAHVAHVSNVHDPNGSCMLWLLADYHVVDIIKTIIRALFSDRRTPGMRFLALVSGSYIMCFTGLLCASLLAIDENRRDFGLFLQRFSQNLREHTFNSNFESILRDNLTNLCESSTTGTSSKH